MTFYGGVIFISTSILHAFFALIMIIILKQLCLIKVSETLVANVSFPNYKYVFSKPVKTGWSIFSPLDLESSLSRNGAKDGLSLSEDGCSLVCCRGPCKLDRPRCIRGGVVSLRKSYICLHIWTAFQWTKGHTSNHPATIKSWKRIVFKIQDLLQGYIAVRWPKVFIEWVSQQWVFEYFLLK